MSDSEKGREGGHAVAKAGFDTVLCRVDGGLASRQASPDAALRIIRRGGRAAALEGWRVVTMA